MALAVYRGALLRQCVCVWVCASSTKRRRGVGALLARICVRAYVCVCVRESAYVHMSPSAHYTWLLFPDRVLCSILHDLQPYEPSSRSFFMRAREFGRSTVLGSQGRPGEPALARSRASLAASAAHNSTCQPVGQREPGVH